MTPHIKEYYKRGGQPILLIMTMSRRALQAWHPDAETGKMARQDALIMDVLHSSAQAISRSEFEMLCAAHKVDPAVPEKGIPLSFKLAALSPDQKASIVPVPTAPQGWQAKNDTRPAPAF